MPVLFVGHGSPMNAIEENQWSRGFSALAEQVPYPISILAVSAHWFVPGTFVTADERPRTIHDFGGFPKALYDIQYPAKGNPDLARRVIDLLEGTDASLDSSWGFDHGTWSVLRRMYPEADCPVVQLSIDYRMSLKSHLEIGHKLGALRDEGVLIMGSGNIVHNLHFVMTSYQRGDLSTPAWARDFDVKVAEAVEQRDEDFFIHAIESDPGRIAHPTLDHYLPLLYAVGASDESDNVHFPISGFDAGSLSMRSILFG